MARFSPQMNSRIIVAFLQDRMNAELARKKALKTASEKETLVQQARLVEAIMAGDLMQIIDAYVAGAELNKPDVVHGDLPFNIAITSACEDGFTLMSNFLDVKVNAIGKEGNTPLHVAADKADVRMIRVLLDRGALTGVGNAKNQIPGDMPGADDACRQLLANAMLSDYQKIYRFKGRQVFEAMRKPAFRPN